jgi:bifunctional non-homologous end joining protein LigD
LYIVNLGTIPLHIWSSRCATLSRPDWSILDLDPKGAPFAHVVEVAGAIRELLDGIELPSFPKTSGSTGLHVLVPLGGLCTYEESRALAELVARIVAEARPDIATTERVIEARGGRVYIDFLQNGHGRLIASPFCVRPLPGAPVSTPLDWSEVNGSLDPKRWNMKTVPDRMRALDEDPMRAVIDVKPDLAAAIGRLSARVAAKSKPR